MSGRDFLTPLFLTVCHSHQLDTLHLAQDSGMMSTQSTDTHYRHA